MGFFRIAQLRKLAQRAIAPFHPKVLILLYHRVAEVPLDPQRLCVKPANFTRHLEHLKKQYPVLSLKELIQALRERRLPRRAVVVTFDDGYADNLKQARPLLERYQIPATVFVTTGYIGGEREFWWDELENLLLHPGKLPETLRLNISKKTYQWELKEAAHYSEELYRRYSGWNIEEKDDPIPRQHLYRLLCQLLRPLPEEERSKALDELLKWANGEPKQHPAHRTLLADELMRLEEGGLVEVGCHTVTHSVLSKLTIAGQRYEIQQSKDSLEEMLGHKVSSFAYPYGLSSDYSAETTAIVRGSGFDCACSGFAGVIRQAADPFQLPRFLMRDWNEKEFARQLKGWFCS